MFSAGNFGVFCSQVICGFLEFLRFSSQDVLVSSWGLLVFWRFLRTLAFANPMHSERTMSNATSEHLSED